MSDRKRSTTTRETKTRESKVCPVCKLPFENRKKWAARGLWGSIVYCSERCRRTARSQSQSG